MDFLENYALGNLSFSFQDDGTWLMFDEGGSPLGFWSWDDEDEEWLFEEFVPLAGLAMPKTGGAPIALLGVAAGLTLIAGGFAFTKPRKRRESAAE